MTATATATATATPAGGAIVTRASRAHIINGTMPHALLLELLTDHGVGTMMKPSTPDETYQAQPLDALASRLDANVNIELG